MVNTNRPTTDVKNKACVYESTTASEHVIDDDSFDITGSEKKNFDSKKVFKYLIPTLGVGAIITIALIISLFVQPVDKDKSNKVAKKDSYNDTSSLEDFLNNENSSSDLFNEKSEDLENTDEESINTNESEDLEDSDNNEASESSNFSSPFNSDSNDNILAMNEPNNVSSYYTNDENASNTNSVYVNNYSNIPTGSGSSYTNNYNETLASNIDISNDVAKSRTDIPLFFQADGRWGSATYAGSTMSHLGSGPTCLSMIYMFFNKNYSYHPLKIAMDSTDCGGVINGVGASPSFMTSYASTLGLKVKEIKVHKNDIISSIMWKKPVIAYMKPGSFSSTGSYIVIRSYDMKYFMINDPNSSANSNIKWKHNDLTNKIEKCWAYYK